MFTNKSPLPSVVAVWVDETQPITRRVYLVYGLSLAVIKYLGDAALIFVASGAVWLPVQYVRAMPSLLALSVSDAGASWWLGPALAFWMLPFVALGVWMSVRRSLDAGRSPWLAILFLMPYANYVLMAVLCALPSRPRQRLQSDLNRSTADNVTAGIVAIPAGVILGTAAVAIGLLTLGSYGAWLFVLTPFAIGACSAFIFNRGRLVTDEDTRLLVVTTVLITGAVLIVVAAEGFVCLLMAMPLALPLAIIGGRVGRSAATSESTSTSSTLWMLLALPLAAATEPASGRALHEVRSSVIIDASPMAVWPHVVSFRELPEPADWLFRAGIAYPIRARIEGSGVGAVRYCVFSTGSFVEPITRWEPGRRLSFDVVDSPPVLEELSLYENLSPPHLHGYLRSKRGEFRLVDLGDGRTRLEGSTWYELEMGPEPYWQIFSDVLIRRIHQRVLRHIEREVESESDPILKSGVGGVSDTPPTPDEASEWREQAVVLALAIPSP